MDLPGTLELPLARGVPYWYWLGGRLALDYANTLRERWGRSVETLVTPDDLAQWLMCAGVTAAHSRVTPQLLGDARELREVIDHSVISSLARRPLHADALAVINRWLAQARLLPELCRDGPVDVVLVPKPSADAARHALGLIAADAAEMLCSPQCQRIRICASTTCSARFYDRSPAAARQWCSPGRCGNRERARRHRAKRA